MTILSKKKTPHNKTEEKSDSPHQNNHNHGLSLNAIPSHSQICERSLEDCLNSGQCCWQNREEKRSAQDLLESGPSSGKRRHKSSPLRSNKLRERVTTGSPRSWTDSPSSSPKAGPSSAIDEDVKSTGYNSGDEYGASNGQCTEAEWVERDRIFEKRMRKKGFVVKNMKEDGACLFRAVSDQVYGDQEMHDFVRKQCMDYIAANRDHYSQYMTEDFNNYVNRKRLDRTHGNHIEIQAMCEMYNRPIEVFCYTKDPINTFHSHKATENTNEPIRLSYQRGSHYNSLVDPHKATIGVGLGLPNFSPGSADRSLMHDAIRQSEDFQIEQTMLEDKLRATDWEATNEMIEEQVARESYLQWFQDNERHKRSMTSATSPMPASSSSTSTSVEKSPNSKPCSDESNKQVAHSSVSVPPAQCSTSDFHINEQATFLNNLPPEVFGISDWEDYGILSQVLATSQQEYLESLKRQKDGDDICEQ